VCFLAEQLFDWTVHDNDILPRSLSSLSCLELPKFELHPAVDVRHGTNKKVGHNISCELLIEVKLPKDVLLVDIHGLVLIHLPFFLSLDIYLLLFLMTLVFFFF